MTVVAWGSYFLPVKYRASSTIFIEKNVIEELVKGLAITPRLKKSLKVLKDTMLSRAVVRKVLEELGIVRKDMPDSQIRALVQRYQRSTEIKKRGEDLFLVSREGSDPEMTRDHSNLLARN
jgi:uncharacterized protein involved in exopolysaccharide biosynthesis